MITESNYFSASSAQQYMSVSQLKIFLDCPARAIAEIKGEYQREETSALLVGSYVDAHFSGTLKGFISCHPEIYTKQGALRAEYSQAQEIIEYISADDLLARMLGGEQQKIVTGEIAGVPFRGKLDCFLSAEQCRQIAEDYPQMATDLMMADGAIVDLKIMRDMQPIYKAGAGRLSFVEAWKYDLQLAIYQHLIGGKLPCYIVCATKEKQPDKALIRIPQYMLDAALDTVIDIIPDFDALKQSGQTGPRCEKCDYCRKTKTISGAIDADELEGGGL